METVRLCKGCAGPLPVDAPEGLCPKCLVNVGLGTETNVQPLATDKAKSAGFVPPQPKDLAAHFPQLEIIELLGQGGMGVVYQARQRQLDRLVALKILPPEAGRDPSFAERFTREARALARLNHPNIVTVYEFGQSREFYYFIMEFVDGVNLRQLEQSRRLTPAEALAIIPKICEALQYAHDEGIVHRDIKPGNILIDKRGRVKIADFGLAKLLGKESADFTLTGSQQVMGTPHYMAPEQMEKPQTVDHRADIYSLGVVFYEMLTGELPIGRFASPSQKVEVDVRLDEVVLKSLAREPERRYQHASEVKTDVETIASTPTQAPPGSIAEPAGPVGAHGDELQSAVLSTFLKHPAKWALALFLALAVPMNLLLRWLDASRTIALFQTDGPVVLGGCFAVAAGFYLVTLIRRAAWAERMTTPATQQILTGLRRLLACFSLVAFGIAVVLNRPAIGWDFGSRAGNELEHAIKAALYNHLLPRLFPMPVLVLLGSVVVSAGVHMFVSHYVRAKELPAGRSVARPQPATAVKKNVENIGASTMPQPGPAHVQSAPIAKAADSAGPTIEDIRPSSESLLPRGTAGPGRWFQGWIFVLFLAAGFIASFAANFGKAGVVIGAVAMTALSFFVVQRYWAAFPAQAPENLGTETRWRRMFNVVGALIFFFLGYGLILQLHFPTGDYLTWAQWGRPALSAKAEFEGKEYRLIHPLVTSWDRTPRLELVNAGQSSFIPLHGLKVVMSWFYGLLLVGGAIFCLHDKKINRRSWTHWWRHRLRLVVLILVPQFGVWADHAMHIFYGGHLWNGTHGYQGFPLRQFYLPNEIEAVEERLNHWLNENGYEMERWTKWSLNTVPEGQIAGHYRVFQIWKPSPFDRWRMTAGGPVSRTPFLTVTLLGWLAREQTTFVTIHQGLVGRGSREGETWQPLVDRLEARLTLKYPSAEKGTKPNQ